METVVYKDFSGGWSGTIDLAKAPENMYDARNMMLYRDGFIGPRPGLKNFSLGRSTTGRPRGIVHMANNSNFGIIYVDGLAVYLVSDQNTGAGSTTPGSLGVVPSPNTHPLLVRREDYQNVYVHIPGVAVSFGFSRLHTNTGSPVLDNVATEGGLAGILYGARYVRGDVADSRIWYSDPTDITIWPAENFVDLRPNRHTQIIYVGLQKNGLTIVDESGRFWTLTGTPGINDALRQVSTTNVRPEPIAFRSLVDGGDDTLWYLSPANNCPATFDGLNHTEMSYLSMTPEDPKDTYSDSGTLAAHTDIVGFPGRDANSIGFIMASNNRMLLNQWGAWGLHEFSTNVSSLWTSDGRGRLFGFAPYTSGATACYTTDLRLNRPAFASDTFASPGDLTTATPVDAYITFPETWSADGDLLKPTEAIIDFKKWNTGSAAANRIQIEVTSLGRGFVPSIDEKTYSREWTQAGSESPASQEGEKDRWRVNLAKHEGAGIRLKLKGLRGVAIGEVRLNYEKVQADGRYG